MAEQAQNQWQAKEIGALWSRKKRESGEKFLTGKLNLKNAGIDREIEVIIFTNKKKQQEGHPDLRIYISEPRQGGSAPAAAAVKKAPVAKAPAPAPAPADDELI